MCTQLPLLLLEPSKKNQQKVAKVNFLFWLGRQIFLSQDLHRYHVIQRSLGCATLCAATQARPVHQPVVMHGLRCSSIIHFHIANIQKLNHLLSEKKICFLCVRTTVFYTKSRCRQMQLRQHGRIAWHAAWLCRRTAQTDGKKIILLCLYCS